MAAPASVSTSAILVLERHGAARWRLRADHREEILGHDAPNWFALEREPRAHLIKIGHGRTVWSVRQGEHEYFAKAFEDRYSLKRCVTSRSSEREWRASVAAQALGIPVVTPVACGVRADRSVFISLAFADAETLSHCWRRSSTGSAASLRSTTGALIRNVARLMAVAHERGLFLRDNHVNNILVARHGACDFESRLVDLIGATVNNRPLKDQAAALSLAALDQHFQYVATRAQRLAFLREYITHRMGSDMPDEIMRRRLKALWPVLIDAKRRHGAILARRRDRRLRADGKYFATLNLGGGWTAIVVLRLARRQLFPESQVPDRSPADWVPLLLSVIQRLPEKTSVPGILMEEYRTGPLACLGRRSRRAFRDAHRRRHRDEPAPLKLAVIEHYSWGVRDFEAVLVPALDERRPSSRI